jgi:hypothetical protein
MDEDEVREDVALSLMEFVEVHDVTIPRAQRV